MKNPSVSQRRKLLHFSDISLNLYSLKSRFTIDETFKLEFFS